MQSLPDGRIARCIQNDDLIDIDHEMLLLPPVLARSGRFTDRDFAGLRDANRSPIDGYYQLPVMTLEQATERLSPFVPCLTDYVTTAKRNCNQDSPFLTWDESAAIYLYTMQLSFYSQLNANLRAKDRNVLKPWFAFLKLFITALEKLPSLEIIVWRGVSGDIDPCFECDDIQIWWSVNSFSKALDVVEAFIGEQGVVFAIKLVHGKDVSIYSMNPDEQEVIMMPGTQVRVKSNPLNFRSCLLIVHLEEESASGNDTACDTAMISTACQSSIHSSFDIHCEDDDHSNLLMPQSSTRICPQPQRRSMIMRIAIVVTTFIILTTVVTTAVLFLSKKQASTFTMESRTTMASPFTPETIATKILPNFDYSRIKAGVKFGESSGYDFDDSLTPDFTSSHYLRGVTSPREMYPLNWIQCHYSSPDDLNRTITSEMHGMRDDFDVPERFVLGHDEKVYKVQVVTKYLTLYKNDKPWFNTTLIRALRLFTTKGRSSESIDHANGEIFTEEYEGYTVGYAAGKSGRYIDQLQFYWYQT